MCIKARIASDSIEVIEYKVLNKPVSERKIDYMEADKWDPIYYARNAVWGARNKVFRATILLKHYILRYMREYLYSEGFIELLPPIISRSSDPGLRGASKLKTMYYGVEYELTSSVIMYKQLSVSVFQKIFYIARNIRSEPYMNRYTGRHLSEFTQLDMEYELASLDNAMEVAEKLVKHVSRRIADEHSELVEMIGCRCEPVVLEPPFPRISYDEALELLSSKGYKPKWGRELSFEEEKVLADYYGSPIWLKHYPASSRGFYYIVREDDERYNMDFNLLLPEGYGELIDGGSREYRYDRLVEKIKAIGEPLYKYSWYLDLVREGAVIPSSGWGLGVERFTRYIAGHRHIVYTTMYPKLPGEQYSI